MLSPTVLRKMARPGYLRADAAASSRRLHVPGSVSAALLRNLTEASLFLVD